MPVFSLPDNFASRFFPLRTMSVIRIYREGKGRGKIPQPVLPRMQVYIELFPLLTKV